MCVFMNPRISRDSDLSKRTSVICYRMDSVSVSGDVQADRGVGLALNATCLHDMFASGAMYGMAEARVLFHIFPRRLLWYFHSNGLPIQAAEIYCKECQKECQVKEVYVLTKYGVGDGCLFRRMFLL